MWILGASTVSQRGHVLPSTAAIPLEIPQPSVGRHRGKSGDYADPDWVYEEIGGNSEEKHENPVTSTPKASAMLTDDVTDDNCFTEQQVSYIDINDVRLSAT